MNRVVIHAQAGQHTISRYIYGHFIEHLGRCIYDGIWVGEESPIPHTRGIRRDVVEALRHLNIPVLRWPGGCFADDYHWADGIGPRETRPRRINQWGLVIENNHFGTHEFMDLCEQVGCKPYICGNVGSGTVREMQEWVEYLTLGSDNPMADLRRTHGREAPWRVPFWGIGNENWGCGGHMSPQQYADLYCQYQTYIRNYGDSSLMKIASGYGGSDTDGKDLDEFLRHIALRRDRVSLAAVSLHYYVFLRDSQEHSATQFGEREWFAVLKGTLEIERAIAHHVEVLDRFDPARRIWLIVDEWGVWYPAEPGTPPYFLYQQNSLRDALVAALTLHIFHAHSDRVRMTNIAQAVNVLQAMILTEGEKMLLTPTYHVFEMYKAHQDATLLPLGLHSEHYTWDGETLPALSASASRGQDGQMHVTLCNLNPNTSLDLVCEWQDIAPSTFTGRVLTADSMNAHNTFVQPDAVRPVAFDAVQINGPVWYIRLPAKSVVALTIR